MVKHFRSFGCTPQQIPLRNDRPASRSSVYCWGCSNNELERTGMGVPSRERDSKRVAVADNRRIIDLPQPTLTPDSIKQRRIKPQNGA